MSHGSNPVRTDCQRQYAFIGKCCHEIGGGTQCRIHSPNDDVGVDSVVQQTQSVAAADRVGNPLRMGMVVGQPIAVMLQGVQGTSSNNSGLPHAAAEQLPVASRLLN